MTGSKPATKTSSDKRFYETDFAKLDAHEITPEEYEEIPELTDEMMARADHHVGGTLIRRGRPPKADAKEAVSIRLAPEVLAHFRQGGPGWQTRINEILLDVARREGARVGD